MELRRGIQYITRGSRPLAFDLYSPPSGTAPLVVMLHGGGWISGDRTMYADEAAWLAAQGFACACIDYRLAPLHPFPAAVADAQEFVRFAKSHAGELQIDPRRVYALGNSAGGHIAAMLGLCQESFESDAQAEPIAGFVSICPITDLTDPTDRHFEISLSFIEQFLGGPYCGNEQRYAAASPIIYARADAPPCLLIHGIEDEVVPVSQSESLHAALQSSRLHMPSNEAHSFTTHGWEAIRRLYSEFFKELAFPS